MRLHIRILESATSLFSGFFSRFCKDVEKGNREAARFLMERCRENVSTPWPPPSAPGQFPHLRTGRGRDSIQVARIPAENSKDPANYEVFVAPPYLHMAYLEEGTAYAWDRVTPISRPWLQPTEEMYADTLLAMRLSTLPKGF